MHWAWQGLCFALPADWDVTVLEKAYLRADDAAGPRLEIVWRQNTPMAEAALRSRLQRLLPDATFDFSSGPTLHALPGVLAFRFARPPESRSPAGVGLVLDLPNQRSAMLLVHQPHPDGETLRADCTATAALLGSLTVAPAGALQPWQAFGLRLAVPATYALQRFHFQPGHFHLQFNGPARGLLRRPEGIVTFDRLGPASMLLRGRSLQEWAATFHPGLPLDERTRVAHPGPCSARWRACSRWSETQTGNWWRTIWGDPGDDMVLSLWLDDEDTKIMALLARGAPAREEPLLRELCAHYAIVPA
ncbi:hypothetical protein DGI_2149 [Megalodesulfovibrio gigas DSM 1382 = ATCC 19364]|uniref:Uncharacterized protein n=1 Tax=Megalodesulfovibrio gigas (strain ATCC 19364 / DSM 1382 / NCIMB 9332 / VKM B-1759) TaxID=1121448 RepID=T2GBE3_MEGG1|nr:hypothetical protein DGI_2149 [Megalodesulfovibrio gigas DSM 1382 = ATCC 19364]